jgi:hypothetical protein
VLHDKGTPDAALRPVAKADITDEMLEDPDSQDRVLSTQPVNCSDCNSIEEAIEKVQAKVRQKNNSAVNRCFGRVWWED